MRIKICTYYFNWKSQPSAKSSANLLSSETSSNQLPENLSAVNLSSIIEELKKQGTGEFLDNKTNLKKILVEKSLI